MAIKQKVSRAEIVVENNEFDDTEMQELFKEVCGNRIATMRIAHEEDGTHLLLYPFKNYEVFSDGVHTPRGIDPDIAWITRLQMPGVFPKGEKFFPTATDVIEKYWKPIRKAKRSLTVLTDDGDWRELSKEEREDLSHIIMYIVGSKSLDSETHEIVTEMEFIVDNRLHRAREGMTADERISHMLNIATKLLAEGLRRVISDIDPKLMAAARMLDELSQEYSEAIDTLRQNRLQDKFNRMGLRYVDNDSRVNND
jgi:hypothetical protein